MKLPIVIKAFLLFIFEWPFYTGFIVIQTKREKQQKNRDVQELTFSPSIGYGRMSLWSSSGKQVMNGTNCTNMNVFKNMVGKMCANRPEKDHTLKNTVSD